MIIIKSYFKFLSMYSCDWVAHKPFERGLYRYRWDRKENNNVFGSEIIWKEMYFHTTANIS